MLGIKALVTRSRSDEKAGIKLANLIASTILFDQLTREFLTPMQGAFFSDCFALSDETPEHRAIYAIREAGNFWRFMFMLGLPCRGAICTGPLYHKGSLVIGPALVSAYTLEKSAAIYPRIIVDPATMDHWRREVSPDSATADLEPLIKRDRDGQYFLDLFHPKWTESFIPWTERVPDQPTPTDPVEFVEEARRQIALGLEEAGGDPDVSKKYEWLADQLQEHGL